VSLKCGKYSTPLWQKLNSFEYKKNCIKNGSGITHAAVWAACCSFIAHNTDEALRPSAQGVLQVGLWEV